METRQIIEIDLEKCNGCGACETGCPEGALRIIDGKARLVGENLCDGLGACIGDCPAGAIRVVEREAEAYDEARVMEGIAPQGANVIAAHLDHLTRHGQDAYAREALAWLAERKIPAPDMPGSGSHRRKDGHAGIVARFRSVSEPGAGLAAPVGFPGGSGTTPAAPGGSPGGPERTPATPGACPGSRSRRFSPASAVASIVPGQPKASEGAGTEGAARANAAPSALAHWPIQLHLVNPRSKQFEDADLLVAADCTAFALGAFHPELLNGRSLVIACPKLDSGREQYLEKLAVLIDSAATVTVAIMEVPCCSGLLKLVLEARQRLVGHTTVEVAIVGIEGGIVTRKTF